LLQSEKLAYLGRLSAGVAHEILNPVNIISIELQILQTMKSLPPEVLEELNICMAQTSRIVTIAENLKQFSRIPEKKAIMADINYVIAHVLTLYATQLKIEGIETEVQYQPDLPVIAMDKEKIEQVILNLITNAMAAMEGKEIKVLRITTARETMFRDQDQLKIMFADTGTGIMSEHMSKLFDPFFTTKGQGKGTGLGLSISYGIIHDHGGRIWAENNEWGGASFYVRLPFKMDIAKKSLLK
jgi:C4-dicarboxylate-specific signal transduction histidine kinase